MKTFLAILFLLATALCHADEPNAKAGSITVTYTGSDGKSHDFTVPNLSSMEVDIPLHISDARRWSAHITCQVDDKGNPPSQFYVNVSDLSALYPAHGDTVAYPVIIMNGNFTFVNGKPVTVLKTPDYSITVTVTLPDDKK